MDQPFPKKNKEHKAKIEAVLTQKLRTPDIKDIDILTHQSKFRDLFKILSLLGVGSFGVVLEVYNKKTESTSALKVCLSSIYDCAMFR